MFLRSYPPGQLRIFKDFVESTICGLHNEILRNKVRDYLATMLISGKPVTDFESFRSLVQIAVESITNRALAGELDSAETAGTNIQLMNYSYIHSEKVGQTDTSSKNRYKVNHLDEDNVTIEEINAFNKFRKYNSNMRRLPREAQEDDVCYNCEKKGHFSRNCPRNMLLTKNGGVNQVEATNVPGLVNSSESEDSSSDEDPRINYNFAGAGAGAGAAGTILPEPEPPGQFCQIRSRSRSRSRSRRNFYNMDPAPVAKPTQIMGKSNFFLQKY